MSKFFKISDTSVIYRFFIDIFVTGLFIYVSEKNFYGVEYVLLNRGMGHVLKIYLFFQLYFFRIDILEVLFKLGVIINDTKVIDKTENMTKFPSFN